MGARQSKVSVAAGGRRLDCAASGAGSRATLRSSLLATTAGRWAPVQVSPNVESALPPPVINFQAPMSQTPSVYPIGFAS
jgi:hypothetical protein